MAGVIRFNGIEIRYSQPTQQYYSFHCGSEETIASITTDSHENAIVDDHIATSGGIS